MDTRATKAPKTMARSKKLAVLVCLFVAAALGLFLAPAKAFAADGYSFIPIQEHSTYTSDRLLEDSGYYSDEWFFADPAERNDELALMSIQLMAATHSNDADSLGSAALKELGFEEVGYTALHDDPQGDVAFVWGKKTISDGSGSYTLVAIVMQNYPSDSELALRTWKENVTLNGADQVSGEHFCWGRAAANALDAVAGLAGSGQVKYWICGHSRGGAITNILSAHLADRLGASNAGIYAYSFESPATVDAGFDNSGYAYIHNYICSDDIVTMLPLWGMTRYGVVHEIKEETDAGLYDELVKLGSDMANAEVADYEEQTRALVAQLEAGIPTRADFSAVQNVSFTDESGSSVALTYSYQEVFQHIIDVALGGEMSGLDADALSDELGAVLPYVKALAAGIELEDAGRTDEANPYYWTAAVGIRDFLVSALPSGELSLSDADFFAIFKAIAPALIDPSYEETGDAFSDVMGYAGPLVDVYLNAGSIVYSHHYDTGIARLKVLAPQPALGDIDIAISQPAAGDSTAKAPQEIAAYIEGLGQDWLTAEASWETSEDALENNTVRYLKVTLTALAHLAADDTQLTVNGVSPLVQPEVSYASGASTVTAYYRFEIGEPASVTISFDAGEHADSPAAVEVQSGTRLAYVAAPEMPEYVTSDGSTWRFAGWVSEDGTAWANIVATADMTVHAKWMLQIDDVRVTFAIPNAGDPLSEPTVDEDAPYYVAKWSVCDEDWSDVDAVEVAGEYHITLGVALKDPENTEFYMEVQDFGDFVDYVYLGVASVNGEERDAYYHDDDFCLSFNYDFMVEEGENPQPQPGPDDKPNPEPTPDGKQDPAPTPDGKGNEGGGAQPSGGNGNGNGNAAQPNGASSNKLPNAGEADVLAMALPLVAVAAVLLGAAGVLRKRDA